MPATQLKVVDVPVAEPCLQSLSTTVSEHWQVDAFHRIRGDQLEALNVRVPSTLCRNPRFVQRL